MNTARQIILSHLAQRPGLPNWSTMNLTHNEGSQAVAQLIEEGKIEWRAFPSKSGQRMMQKLAIREA